MADTDQMTRAELLEARKRVKNQLRILLTPTVGFPAPGHMTTNRDELRDELNQILGEINAELAEMDAKNS
jgi:hypothetical protein